jgi:hypothetical protein
VTGAIVFSVAFLEASINEFYLEARDANPHTLKGLSTQQIAVVSELCELVERDSPLNKCQVAMAACGIERFDRGAEPFQGSEALVRLRNALIHYRPEWDDELETHRKLEEGLSGRFDPNPLSQAGSLWFPHQCLGSGCAMWSIKQAEKFMGEFCVRLGVPSRVP